MKLQTQEQKQTKVVVLSHVKESSVIYSESVTTTTSSKRIAWPGGNITSNKHEALLKFYQRKIQNGELNEHQLKAAQAALGKDFEIISQMTSSEKSIKCGATTTATITKSEISKKKDHKHKNNKKVSGQNNQKVFTINGRTVGPKANSKKTHQQHNRSPVYNTSTSTSKTTQINSKQKKQQQKKQKQKHPKQSIALHDQLGMSLDVLVSRKHK